MVNQNHKFVPLRQKTRETVRRATTLHFSFFENDNQESNPYECQLFDVAIEAALEAGKILREEYALPPDIHYKGTSTR
jgi:hypothetical protein